MDNVIGYITWEVCGFCKNYHEIDEGCLIVDKITLTWNPGGDIIKCLCFTDIADEPVIREIKDAKSNG